MSENNPKGKQTVQRDFFLLAVFQRLTRSLFACVILFYSIRQTTFTKTNRSNIYKQTNIFVVIQMHTSGKRIENE